MTNVRTIVVGIAAFCTLAPAIGSAQTAPSPISELTLEQLMNVEVGTVFGASRYRQRVTDAPAAVSIITHEEIERFGYRNLGDVLRGVRGFYVTNDRNYSYVGVRGFGRPGDYNTRVLILIDGHRLNETTFDSAYIGEDSPVPMELVDRIEIIRGPGSSLYGTNAIFGVVNVITRSAASLRSTQVSVEGGSLGRRGATVVFGRENVGGSPLVLGLSGYGSEGQSDVTVPGVGVAHDMDDEDGWKAFGSRGYGNWLLTGLYTWRSKRIPTGAFGTDPADPRSNTDDARGYLDLSYDSKWRGNGVFFRAAYDRYAYDGAYAYFPAIDGDPNDFTRDGARAEWLTAEAMLSRRIAQRHFVTGGVEYRNNYRQDQWARSIEPVSEEYLRENRSSRVFAAYGQDEMTLSSRLTVTAGVRHDRTGDLDSTNLRLAAIFKPVERTSLKLLHGSAFRAPNPYELYYYTNPAPLLPERIQTTEAVWEQYVGKGLRTSISGFVYHAHDLISQIPYASNRDEFAFANVDEARAPGVELEAEGTWRGLHMLASYTYQDVRSGDDRQRISNSPRNMTRARVTGPVYRDVIFFGAEGLYTGDRDTLAGGVADGAFLGNLTISSREISRAKFAITIGNLFNKSYVDPGAEEHPADVISQVGRTMRAHLAWRF